MALLQIPQGAAALNYLKGLPKAEGVVDIGDHIRGQVQPSLRLWRHRSTSQLRYACDAHLGWRAGLSRTAGHFQGACCGQGNPFRRLMLQMGVDAGVLRFAPFLP